MKKRPEVSIITATFNRSEFLMRAVKSVLNQSFQNWEQIIIDDGSTDQTKEILKPLIKQNDNIKYHYQQNQGFAAACNAGFKIANGKYIALLDSDDEYTIDHLEKRIDYFSQNPNIDLTHGGFQLIGTEEDWYVPDADHPGKKIHLSKCVIGGTFFGKKEVFQELNGFDENLKFAHDYDFVQRATNKFTISKVDYPTYIYYRNHNQSICRDFEQNQ